VRLRRCRYVGLIKTHLQHVITAVALNLVRVAEWYNDTHSAKHAYLAVCGSTGGSLTGAGRMKSPPVSMMAEGHREVARSVIDGREHEGNLAAEGRQYHQHAPHRRLCTDSHRRNTPERSGAF
jgi:hypothetical protein